MEHQRNAIKQKAILTIIVIAIAHAAGSTAGATRYTALQQSDFTVVESFAIVLFSFPFPTRDPPNGLKADSGQ